MCVVQIAIFESNKAGTHFSDTQAQRKKNTAKNRGTHRQLPTSTQLWRRRGEPSEATQRRRVGDLCQMRLLRFALGVSLGAAAAADVKAEDCGGLLLSAFASSCPVSMAGRVPRAHPPMPATHTHLRHACMRHCYFATYLDRSHQPLCNSVCVAPRHGANRSLRVCPGEHRGCPRTENLRRHGRRVQL